MHKKAFNGKTILFIIIIAIITVLVILKNQYESEKEIQKSIKKTVQPKVLSYSDIKRNNLVLFEKKFNRSNITVIFFEYRYNNEKEALIIRQDSVTCIISQFNTQMVNSFNDDSIAWLSFELMDIMDKQIDNLPFQEAKNSLLKIEPRGIKISIKNNDGQVLSLNINHQNKDEASYKEISKHFLNLINKIKKSDITIEKLIANHQ
jgi:hypothetical protein